MAVAAFQADVPDDLADACGGAPGEVCRWVFEQTENATLAGLSDWVIEKPLRVLLIVVVAWLVNRIVRRFIGRVVVRISNTSVDERLRTLRELSPGNLLAEDEAARARSSARAETVGFVLRSFSTAVIWSIAALVILAEFDIDLAPLLAGAGIAGVALGFGAQSVVKDFLTGVFMLIEDQYGVGDIIDLGDAIGTVEKVSLRTTTIRDVQGTVWHIPNGEITRVGNFSQLWSRALIDVDVAYESDVRLAQGIIQRVANDMWDDPEWGGDEIMSAPEVWGVQNLGPDAVQIRLVVKTEPSEQWRVERELRLRIKEALDEAGIEIPFSQRTVWLRNQGEAPRDEPTDPATVRVAPIADAHDDEASGSDVR